MEIIESILQLGQRGSLGYLNGTEFPDGPSQKLGGATRECLQERKQQQGQTMIARRGNEEGKLTMFSVPLAPIPRPSGENSSSGTMSGW